MPICHKCERDLELMTCVKCKKMRFKIFSFCKECYQTHVIKHNYTNKKF